MSYQATQLAIENFIQANWPHTSVPIIFDNVHFDPQDTTEWIRVSVKYDEPFQASLGDNPAFRYFGVLFFQIFLKPDVGSGRAAELADTITSLFRAQTISGLTFRVPEMNPVTSRKPMDWYQVNVSITFFRGE